MKPASSRSPTRSTLRASRPRPGLWWLATALVAGMALAWIPTVQALQQPSADQLFDWLSLTRACSPDRLQLGWIGAGSDGSLGLFTASLPAQAIHWLSCQLARHGPLNPLQSFLVLGLMLTFLLALISCRRAGFLISSSLLAAFLISTAPCSFSRIGHLTLAALWPVIPALLATHSLWRVMLPAQSRADPAGPIVLPWEDSRQARERAGAPRPSPWRLRRLLRRWRAAVSALARPVPLVLAGARGRGCRGMAPLAAGAIAACLTLPSHDYPVAFSLLLLLACCCLLLLLASATSRELAPLRAPCCRGAWFLLGFALVVAVLFLPKLLAAGLLGGSAGPGAPPATWSTPRSANEQFLYGMLPFTWLIPAPWVSPVLGALNSAGLNTASESYFWSTGSLLIPIAWLLAIRRLAQPGSFAAAPPGRSPGLQESDRRFLALLLLLTSALGMLVMTMGGLGTLFAVFISPVLRSLNRFSAFVYGAAVLSLAAEFDLWLRHRDPTP